MLYNYNNVNLLKAKWRAKFLNGESEFLRQECSMGKAISWPVDFYFKNESSLYTLIKEGVVLL